jgi:hypothetical protein
VQHYAINFALENSSIDQAEKRPISISPTP